MKKIILACLLAVPFAQAAVAGENDRDFYVGGFALLGFADTSGTTRDPVQPTPLNTSSDTAGVNGGAGAWLGYDFASSGVPVRAELAGTWRYRHDMNVEFIEAAPTAGLFEAKADIQTIDFMASALYDLPVDWAIKPYVGAGVGVAHVQADSYLLNPGKIHAGTESQWNFAWQLQGGVNYALSSSWDFRVDYRYIDLGEVTTARLASGDQFSADLASHDIRIGAAYRF